MLKINTVTALVSVACVLGASAGAASAAEFRAFKGATEIKGAVAGVLTGSGEQKLTIGTGIAMVCTELKATEKEAVPSTSVKGLPIYSGCKAKVSGVSSAATITNTGCPLSLFVTGTASVVCSAGSSIVIVIGSLCTIKVPGQEGLKKVTYTPLETKTSTITGVGEITGIKQENNCSITGEVQYVNASTVKPTEAGVTMEIK